MIYHIIAYTVHKSNKNCINLHTWRTSGLRENGVSQKQHKQAIGGGALLFQNKPPSPKASRVTVCHFPGCLGLPLAFYSNEDERSRGAGNSHVAKILKLPLGGARAT